MTARRIRLPRLRGLLEGPRIALALRTAIAAALAWYLAPYVPLAEDDYSYYAPLGVLVSMYPTLAGSARSGMQTLVGLAVGIALGFGGIAVTWLGAPGIVALALVVGVGVWLGGIASLGAGRDWVAMAGLFVLLLGGATPEEFSLSYIVTMAFGVAVGLLVNLVLFPPLYLRQAAARLSHLRDAVAGHLHDVADAVAQHRISSDQLAGIVSDLRTTVEEVTQAVEDAHESSRANPRARGHIEERDLNSRRLHALERTVFSVRDLADVLARADEEGTSPERALKPLTAAIHAVAELVAEPAGTERAAELLRAADQALADYTAVLDAAPTATGPTAVPSDVASELTAAVCLRRMIDASRPFV
ncbi:FUSC family protein [Microbacterium sp. NEAU-LLB]|uniref:FUSC family protein n=2 Tax=Microbacterium stercoris TaxID=2820289 RepID=A0A939TND5_9MICO|nr:FUSC family protein [Microbacterium stercoris]